MANSGFTELEIAETGSCRESSIESTSSVKSSRISDSNGFHDSSISMSPMKLEQTPTKRIRKAWAAGVLKVHGDTSSVSTTTTVEASVASDVLATSVSVLRMNEAKVLSRKRLLSGTLKSPPRQ